MSRRRKPLLVITGWVISVVLVVGMVSTVPLGDVWMALRQVDPLFILLAMGFTFVNLWLRGGRWAILFLPHCQVSRTSASSLITIGLVINAVLPGRIGELARAGMAAKKFRTGLAFTTTTVVIERLLDAVTLLMFLGLSLFFLPKVQIYQSAQLLGQRISGETLTGFFMGLALACLILGVLIVGIAIPKIRETIIFLVSKVPCVGEWLKQKIEHVLIDVGRGLSIFKSPRKIFRLFLYTVCIWFALAICNLCVSFGMKGINLTFLQAIVVTSVSIAASSIPSAPGAWGVFEAGALLSLMALNVHYDQAVGVAYVLTIHISQYLPVLLSGVIVVAKERGAIRNFRHISQSAERR